MPVFKIDKVVAALPTPLDADTVYAVRTGVGYDLYISDNTGSVAHALNDNKPSGSVAILINDSFVQQTITGIANILTTSKVQCWVGNSTTDNDAEAHVLANAFLAVKASDVIAGVGFTLNITNQDNAVSGLIDINWSF